MANLYSFMFVIASILYFLYQGCDGLDCYSGSYSPTSGGANVKEIEETCGAGKVCVHMSWIAKDDQHRRRANSRGCGPEGLCSDLSFRQGKEWFKCYVCRTNLCNSSWSLMPNVLTILLPVAILRYLWS